MRNQSTTRYISKPPVLSPIGWQGLPLPYSHRPFKPEYLDLIIKVCCQSLSVNRQMVSFDFFLKRPAGASGDPGLIKQFLRSLIAECQADLGRLPMKGRGRRYPSYFHCLWMELPAGDPDGDYHVLLMVTGQAYGRLCKWDSSIPMANRIKAIWQSTVNSDSRTINSLVCVPGKGEQYFHPVEDGGRRCLERLYAKAAFFATAEQGKLGWKMSD